MKLIRRAAVLAVLAAHSVLPTTTHAGTYEVISCAAAGGANHAWQGFNDDSTTLVVGDSCASVSGGPEDGLFAVDRIPGPPNAPKDRAAGWRFTSPTGTRISRVTAQYYLGQNSGGEWSPYIRTGEGSVLDTCQPPGGDPECARGTAVADPLGPMWTYPVDTQTVEAGVRCNAAMGACGNGALLHAAWVALYSTRVQITDPTPPAMPVPAPPPADAPHYERGDLEATVDAADSTGIRRTRVEVDGVTRSERAHPCDYAYITPCASPLSATHVIDTRALADGSHTLRLVAEDAAGNTAVTTQSRLVDNTAPTAPLQLAALRPADAPSTFPVFELVWRNPPGQVARIAVAHWSVCRVGGGECVGGSRGAPAGAELTSTGSIGPLGKGKWDARVWLQDGAGNVEPHNAAGPVRVTVREGAARLRSPRLKLLRVRRRGNVVSVRGTSAVRAGRVHVRVERRISGRLRRASGKAPIRGGRWATRVRLRGPLAHARRTRLLVRYGARANFAGQTLRRSLRR